MEKGTKMLLMLCVLLALLVSGWAQESKPAVPAGTRIGSATRLVVIFNGLERQLVAAIQKHDHVAIDRLLAPDFQEWSPEPPGEPTPRAVWVGKVATAGAPQPFSIEQMAVRGLNGDAIASFVLLEGHGGRQTAQYVVDVWARSGTEWKLTDRYTAQVPASPYARERKPTGKE